MGSRLNPKGEEKVQLTTSLLALILMVQDYSNYQLRRSILNSAHKLGALDFQAETLKMFKEIDSNILEEYKLSPDQKSFNKVMNFEVTDEMKKMKRQELEEKFTF